MILMRSFIIVLPILTMNTLYSCLHESATLKEKKSMMKATDWIHSLNKSSATEKEAVVDPSYHSLPLIKKYPQIILPYVPLCQKPSPVHHLSKLSALLNTSLFIKRDDISCGTLSYGGNKPRKLEFELAEALRRNATSVITFGCAGSNHAIATSTYAQQLGLKAICMLKPQANARIVQKNLLAHNRLNTELHYSPDNETRQQDTVHVCEELMRKGEKPYLIPTGGSTPLGSVGFVNAAFELKYQIDNHLLPQPDYIYVPCGSAGTTAGLLLGCKAAGIQSHIIAVAVEPEEHPVEQSRIHELFYETNNLLSITSGKTFPLYQLFPEDFSLTMSHSGRDYGVFTQEGIAARALFKEHEAIELDGTYTAKACAALLFDTATHKIKNKTVLFWHTYHANTAPESQADYRQLPPCFHHYFTEDVQQLDQ